MPTLRTTSIGLALITAFESIKTSAYTCPAGKPTIGIGHTSAAGGSFETTDGKTHTQVALGQRITEAEAHRLFAADIDQFEDGVERLIARAPVAPNENEFDALVSLAFNIGIGNFSSSTVLKRFLRGDKAGAAEAMLAWNKMTVNGKKVVAKGLVRRREAERWLFLGDIELAEKFAQTKFGPMPRIVSEPVLREPMLKSATGNTAVITGGAGIAAAVEGVKQVLAAGQELHGTAIDASSLLLGSGSPWVLVAGFGIVVAIGAGIIWYRRWQRSKEDEIIESDPGMRVNPHGFAVSDA